MRKNSKTVDLTVTAAFRNLAVASVMLGRAIARTAVQQVKRHKVLMPLAATVGIAAALGHHEMTWLILASQYDRVFRFITGE